MQRFVRGGCRCSRFFTNHVEDEAQFELPWKKVLFLSDPFFPFTKRLLSRSDGFETSKEALECLKYLPGQKHTFLNTIADKISPININLEGN